MRKISYDLGYNPNNYNNTATAVTGPAGNTAVTGSGGNTAVVSNSSSSVKRSDIPPGRRLICFKNRNYTSCVS